MGIAKYNDEIIHDQNRIHFFPIFCRLSIKDVKLNTVSISAVSAAAAAAEPSSPRVTCTGQVKRSNRVTAAPTTTSHHHKPRRIQHFSTKTLLPNPATATPTAAAARSRSCRGNRDSRRPSVRKSSCDQDCVRAAVVDISKMDPPLPVVKRAPPPPPGNCSGEANLWKRRFKNVNSMEIEPIHLPSKNFPTTL